MSAFIAVRLATVSSSVSPLVCDDVAILRFTTSAESRLAAISNVVRVRVLGSKNRLKIALPRSNGTFFTSCSVTETNERAVSRICSRTSGVRPSMVRRCLSLPSGLSCRLAPRDSTIARLQLEAERPAPVALQYDRLVLLHAQLRADILRADRQLTAAAIDERREPDRARATIVEDFVHRRPDGAAGVEDIVDQNDIGAFHLEADIRGLNARTHPGLLVVIAPECDIDRADRRKQGQHLVQALGNPHAAGINSDQRRGRPGVPTDLLGEVAEQALCVRKTG